jgi:vancomycin resistance protein YoaR
VTDQNQTPDQQGTPQSPQEGTVPSLDSAVAPESVTEPVDLDKTLELPQIPAEPQQADAAQPSPPVAEPAPPVTEQPTLVTPVVPLVALPDEMQPPSPETTAVMPQVPPAPSVADVALATEGLAPSPPDLIPPSADLDQTLSDTSDFTLSDITFTDAGSGGLMGWLRGHKPRFGSTAQSGAGPATAPIDKPRRWGLRPWQWALIGVGVVVLIIAVLIGVDGGLYYDKVHHGVRVAGQDLSGMSSSKATQTLTDFADEAQKKPIALKSESGDHTWDVLPSDLGTTIDVPAAVAKAMALTRKGNFLADLAKKIGLYFNGDDIPLEGAFDKTKMDELLAKISTTLDVPATNATLVVNNGAIEVLEGKQGTVVDTETLRAALIQLLFTFHSTDLPIPMVTTSPDLSAIDITPALDLANVMIDGELTITFKGQSIATVAPSEIITYLDVAPGTGGGSAKTVPILSAAKMMTLLDTVDTRVSTPGVNATFEVNTDTKTLTLVAGSNGEGLDRQATAAALTQAAMNATGRTAEVVLKPVPPELTTEEVQAMGIKDLLGDYKTTPYVGTKNRQINVRLATKLCSGVFLAPGEEFNTDKRLGVRDAAHGWASAPGIVGPGQLEDVPGGGICQVSTTLFNAALVSGLEITKRYNHSIFINHYPDGRDATVTSGGKNMCFRNDTANYIFIYGWSSGINTHFYIFGANDGRKVLPIQFSGFSLGGSYPTTTIVDTSLPLGSTKEDFAGQRSRSCSITRTVVYADGTQKSQTWSSRWSMLPKVVLTNPKPVTTTTGGGGGGSTTTVAPTTTSAP